jgi:hypothetical protein
VESHYLVLRDRGMIFYNERGLDRAEADRPWKMGL